MADSIFEPTEVEFTPVQKALAWVRLISLSIVLLVLLIAVLVMIFADQWGLALILGVGTLVLGLWLGWLIPRQVKAIRWALTETDLLIGRGVMFRSLTTVPVGRLQYVDMEQGPLARAFGIATVKLHTASATTDASIPGLSQAQADWLRNELSRRGEAHLEGL